MKSLLTLVLCGLILFAIGCGDEASTMDPEPINDNLPPAVTGPESVNAAIGVPATFEVIATDPDGDEIELVVVVVVSLGDWRRGIRAGEASADSETGVITFTPNANDTPQRTLVVTAKDPSGATASVDVPVLVSTPPLH